MPAVAKAIGKDLAALAPSHEAYFTAEVAAFDTSLAPWTQAIAALKSSSSGPGGDHRAGGRLHAPGCWARQPDPVAFQADVMNGVDPSAQDVSLEQGFFTGHQSRPSSITNR